MKKVKVTRRPGRVDYILLPNRLRMFIIYFILFTLAVVFGFLIRFLLYRTGLDSDWLLTNGPTILGLIILVAAVVPFIERRRWTLRVAGGEKVEGPTGAFGDRMAIPLREINWDRTRRSLTSGFKLGNAIHGPDRDRILVSPWFYNPGQFREFLKAIGFEEG